MSVWNPNLATPSPSSLLNSLLGQAQTMDSFQYAPPPNNSYTSFNSSYTNMNDSFKSIPQTLHSGVMPIPMDLAASTYTTQYSHPTSVRYKDTFNWNALSPRSLAARDGIGNGNGSGMLDMDPLSLDTGSSDSTPISLNSTNAFHSTFAFVQQEYRDRPELPAYLYQLQMLEQPDLLTPFFPSLEQRHQVSRFPYFITYTALSPDTSSFATFSTKPHSHSSPPQPPRLPIPSYVISPISPSALLPALASRTTRSDLLSCPSPPSI